MPNRFLLMATFTLNLNRPRKRLLLEGKNISDKKKVEKMTFIIMALLFALLALGIAGTGDIEAEETQARVYNEMVCAGHWPDYENRKPTCE